MFLNIIEVIYEIFEKDSVFLVFPISAQAAKSDWVTLDSKLASCGASATIIYNLVTQQKYLSVSNIGCKQLMIALEGHEAQSEMLVRGKVIHTSITEINGQSLPIFIDGQSLILNLAPATKFAQVDDLLKMNEQNFPRTRQGQLLRKAEEATIGAVIALSAATVGIQAVTSSEP